MGNHSGEGAVWRPSTLGSRFRRAHVHGTQERSTLEWRYLFMLFTLVGFSGLLAACGSGSLPRGGTPTASAISVRTPPAPVVSPVLSPTQTAQRLPTAVTGRTPGQEVWAEVRAVLPTSVPVYRPAFIPDRFGPAVLEQVETGGQYAPRYTVVYHGERELLAFILGVGYGALGNMPGPPTIEPTTVHGGQGYVLVTPGEEPGYLNFLGVTWHEGSWYYQIKAFSERLSKDELLRILGSLAPVP